jgi:AraC-like DNA-binding protein
LASAFALVVLYLFANVAFYLLRSYLAYRTELEQVAQGMVQSIREAHDDLFEDTIRTILVLTDQETAFRDALLTYDGSYDHRTALLQGLSRIQATAAPVQSAYAQLSPTNQVFSAETGRFYEWREFYDPAAARLMRDAGGVRIRHARVLRFYGDERSYSTLVLTVRDPKGHAAIAVNFSEPALERALLQTTPGAGDHRLDVMDRDMWVERPPQSPDAGRRVFPRTIRAVVESESFDRVFALEVGSVGIAAGLNAAASFAGISLVAAAAVFLGFASVLTRSLKPLDRVLEHVRSTTVGGMGTDISDLESYLSTLMADNERLRGEYHRLLPERKRELLRDLFSGHIESGVNLEDRLQFNELTMPPTGLVAACLLLEVQDLPERRRIEATAVVERLLVDSISDEAGGFHVPVGRDQYGLAVPAPKNAGVSDLESPFASLLAKAPELIRRRMFVGVGLPTRRFADLVTSYEQAQSALEYRRTLGRHVLCAAMINSLKGQRYRYPYERERLLVERLHSGDEDGSLEVLNKMLDQIVGDKLGDREIEYLRLRLIHALNRYLYEHELSVDDEERLDRKYDTSHAMTIEEVRAILTDIVRRIVEAQREHRNTSRAALVHRFTGHITANCASPSYQLLDLEEEFGLSRYYIGQLIAEHTGKHFNDHLNEARVRAAAELLVNEPGLPVKEVASRVGYAYAYYFIRQFKRIQGVTPKVYRDTIIASARQE